jgi:eukaryotic-like serine/threonine-protein kinase
MDRDRERVEEAFHEARALPPGERASFLERRFPGEPELARRVLRLVEAEAGADAYFADLANRAGVPPLAADDEVPGEGRIGVYRLLEVIGRGGMGTVYRACRDDQAFDKEVAVKVLPPGLGTDHLRDRFQVERQILAGLEHPGISRLIDGGVTPGGTPYLVMELVEGEPIDRYCSKHGLNLDTRIDLFLEACDAVEYAHRNLVVHRDLKPDNILVDADGRVRLLDFGIAKVISTGALGTGAVDLTRRGVSLLTPAFASPEQLQGRTITTASDVYSLGLLLYLLLTDRRAYDLTGLSAAEREERICHRDPPPPSRAVAEPEQRRRARRLRGDLDAIVLTALAKDPADRYGSVSELVEDLERHRAGRPIAARAPTPLYRASRFLRRNRLLVGTGTTITGLLVALSVVAVASARASAEQAERLALERDRAEQVTSFLVHAFEQANPAATGGTEATARDILHAGATRANVDLVDQPEVRAEFLVALADISRRLGLRSQGVEMARQALEIREGLPGIPWKDDFDLRFLVAQLTDGNAGVELFRELIPDLDRRFSSDPLEQGRFLSTYAGRLYWASAAEEKADTFERAIALLREAGDEDEARLSLARTLVTSTYGGENPMRHEEAMARGLEALEIRRGVHGREHPAVATTLSDLALFQERVDPLAADTLMRQAYEMHRATAGESHPTTITILNNLAGIKRDRGDLVEAEPLFREALRLRMLYQPEERIPLAYSEFGLGVVLIGLGRPDEAIPYLQRVVDTFAEADPRGRLARERLAEAQEALVGGG